MVQLELDNLRILLLNNESVELGLTISENLSDIEFNELVLGNNWKRVHHCDAPVYETYIKDRRLIIYCYINCGSLQHLEFILSPNDERFKFNLRTFSIHKNGWEIDENYWFRNWLITKILRGW